jgi:superfamily II DNA or RNA helicase
VYSPNDVVKHTQFGPGRVIIDDGQTVVAQFEHGIERCLRQELERLESALEAARRELWAPPLEVITRAQAEAIQSVNDGWGVLSRSRIALLPHQLWVCRRVNESWPIRWLVADDVGLGKTIEAGLILWPLLSRGTIRRLLILCPASLVEQWQERLRTMFDIRLARYVAEADTAKSDFWHTHPQVVASLQTLRKDSVGRHRRMLEAPPWDLLVVDEAHHLNADEETGPTLGNKLIERLAEEGKTTSLLFFTGTPHRGKDFGFLSLLRLLRPDVFDPKLPLAPQLPQLRQVMIRNNKQNVTDLKGNRLFHATKVSPETYTYSRDEAQFYDMLTEFISTGKAYASTMSSSDQRAAMLVLIAMQKLASSSVAAIRRALKNRLAKIRTARKDVAALQERKRLLESYEEFEAENEGDDLNQIEEQIAEHLAELRLMEDEELRLEELIASAERVKVETKIARILEILDERFAERSVLFFTEYKATQSLLMSELVQRYGEACVTFINGDGRADEVKDTSGRLHAIITPRAKAAERFNSGSVRFLVSTEAAGEGIDLQEHAYTLIHVDLPWNPMRLHQRVGRLNRYGQKRRVEAVTLRNPSTVESRIWDKLNAKIDRIMQALGEVMDEPEDLLELVLGMTSPRMFREVFAEAASVSEGTLAQWFDSKTAQFGGRDALDTVRNLVGHCSHFDYQEVTGRLPRLDLPALRPFFHSMLALNGRRPQVSESGLSFKTPEAWLTMPAIRSAYSDMVFERQSSAADRVLGVGHPLIDLAVKQARGHKCSVAPIPEALLPEPVLIFSVSDRVTSSKLTVRRVVVGVRLASGGLPELLRDSELLTTLNGLTERRTFRRDAETKRPSGTGGIESACATAAALVQERVGELEVPYQAPEVQLLVILWPSSGKPEPELPGEVVAMNR